MSAHFCIGAFSQFFHCNRFLGGGGGLVEKGIIGLDHHHHHHHHHHHQAAEMLDSLATEAENVPVELRRLLDAKQEPFVLQEAIQEKKRPVRRKGSSCRSRLIVDGENSTAAVAATNDDTVSSPKIREFLQKGEGEDATDNLSDGASPPRHRAPPERMLVVPADCVGHSSPSKKKGTKKNHPNLSKKKAMLVDAAIKILEGSSHPSRKQLSSASLLLQLAEINGGQKDRRLEAKQNIASSRTMTEAQDRSDPFAETKRPMAQLRILQRKQKSESLQMRCLVNHPRAAPSQLLPKSQEIDSQSPIRHEAGSKIGGNEEYSQIPTSMATLLPSPVFEGLEARGDRSISVSVRGSPEHCYRQPRSSLGSSNASSGGSSPGSGGEHLPVSGAAEYHPAKQNEETSCGGVCRRENSMRLHSAEALRSESSDSYQGHADGGVESHSSPRVLLRSPPLSLKLCDDENSVDGSAPDAAEFQQSSPVSVLDTMFEEEDSSMASSDVFDNFEETKQQLLLSVRRFEMLAQMDVEMLMKLAEEEEGGGGSMDSVVGLENVSDKMGSEEDDSVNSLSGTPPHRSAHLDGMLDLIYRFRQGTRPMSDSMMMCCWEGSFWKELQGAHIRPWPELPEEISEKHGGTELAALATKIEGMVRGEMGGGGRYGGWMEDGGGVGEVERRLEDAVMAMLMQELVMEMV